MLISLIAAIGKRRELGLNNKLLWRLKEDLQNFKRVTLDHHILMGRKTYESIGRPLPQRVNMVLSLGPDAASGDSQQGITRLRSLKEAFLTAQAAGESELFVIGGGHVYEQVLPFADRLYLTRVDYTGEADTFFPEFEHLPWQEIAVKSYPAQADSPAWTYHILVKQAHSWQDL